MKKIFEEHLPEILSYLACGGVFGTAFLAIKNTQKAEKKKAEGVTDKKDIYLKSYWPTVLSAVATCGCILGSNGLNEAHKVALASACSMVGESYSQYRNKVIERHGIEEHKEILNSIAAENCKPVDIYSYGSFSSAGLSAYDLSKDDKVQLFYDGFSRRYFNSTLARVMDAEYNLNRNFCLGDVVSLNDWYAFLGLEQTIEGNELGWFLGCEDEYFWLDFDHEERHLEDGTPYIYICMGLEPSTKWQEAW